MTTESIPSTEGMEEHYQTKVATEFRQPRQINFMPEYAAIEQMRREVSEFVDTGDGPVTFENMEVAPGITQSVEQRVHYARLWRTQDGEEVTVAAEMVGALLSKRDEYGEPVWSAVHIPAKRPAQVYACRLHASDPQRSLWDTLGFKRCPKADLVTLVEAMRHLQFRHKKAFQTILDMESQAEKEKWNQREERLIRSNEMMAESLRAANLGPREPLPVGESTGKKSAGS